MTGRFFEDYREGEQLETAGRTITEANIQAFADLSGDHNPLHLDPIFAAGGPFGVRVAHGLLGLSIASGLVAQTGIWDRTVLAFLGLDWKFIAPLHIGDTIKVFMRVAEKRKTRKPERGVVVFEASVRNQRDEAVQEGRWTLLVAIRKVEKSD